MNKSDLKPTLNQHQLAAKLLLCQANITMTKDVLQSLMIKLTHRHSMIWGKRKEPEK